MRQVYTSMRPELKIYINLLTGERVIYEKADMNHKPQGSDIIDIKILKKEK